MLTSSEIQKLHNYLNARGIPYLDLQAEIVDHMATAIEELRLANSELSFETAFNRVKSNPPIFSVKELLRIKAKSINHIFSKKYRLFLKEILYSAKIFWVAILCLSIYMIVQSSAFDLFCKSILYLLNGLWVFRLIYGISIDRLKISHYLSLIQYHSICFTIFCIHMCFIDINEFQSITKFSVGIQVGICVLLSIYLLSAYWLLIILSNQIRIELSTKV